MRSGEKRHDPRQHTQVGHRDPPLEAAGEAVITTVIDDLVAVATAALIIPAPIRKRMPERDIRRQSHL